MLAVRRAGHLLSCSPGCCGASPAGTHDAVGHQVVPVKLPATVVLLVEILHLWDEVFQLCRQGDEDLLAAPRPCSGVQDLYVDGVG